MAATVTRRPEGSYIDGAREYGITGRDPAWDTPMMLQAIKDGDAQGRRPVKLRGEVEFTDTVTPNTTVVPRVIGDGPDSTRIYHAAKGKTLFAVTGGQSTNHTLAAAADRFATEVELPSGDSLLPLLAEGDWVIVSDPSVSVLSPYDGAPQGYYGQAVRVRAVDGTTVKLREPLLFPMTATGRMKRVEPMTGPLLANLSIYDATGDDPSASTYATNFFRTVGARLMNLVFHGCTDDAIRLDRAFDSYIAGVRFQSFRNDLAWSPYCIRVGPGCAEVIVNACRGRYGRHLVTTIGDSGEVLVRGVHVSDCVASEFTSAPFDTHWAAMDVTFADCHARGRTTLDTVGDPGLGGGAGFQLRGFDITVRGGSVANSVGGVTVPGGVRCKVQGLRLSDVEYGIVQRSGTDNSFKNILMERVRTAGIVVDQNGEATAPTGMEFDRIRIEGETSEAAVQFRSWDNSFRVGRIEIPDAAVKMTGRRPTRVDAAATVELPDHADLIEVRGATTITNLPVDPNHGRQVALSIPSGLTLSAGQAALSSTTIAPGTLLNLKSTGTRWAEVSRVVVPLDTPLDGLTATAWRAYGFRKYRAAYAGDAIRVRRSSDSTEQDIGFDASGLLDVAALLSFAAGGSAYVKTLYDQSASGYDLTQATTAAQPRIVNAGVLDTLNTMPAMVFDGTDDCFVGSNPGMWVAGAASIMMILASNWTTGGNRTIIGESSSSSSNPLYEPAMAVPATGAGRIGYGIRNDANTAVLSFGDGGLLPALDGEARLVYINDTGTSFTHNVDASANITRAFTRAGSTLTLDRFSLGARGRPTTPSQYFQGALGGLVVFTSVLSAADEAVLRASMRELYATA